MSLAGMIVLVAFGLGLAWWRSRPERLHVAGLARPGTAENGRSGASRPPRVPFTDVTREAGIEFVHENGAAGQKLLPETMGSGCAFLDYDGDGDQDLLLVNARTWPWDSRDDAVAAPAMTLYRNDGTGKFSDVTKSAGLESPLYGVGVAVGDYDNDRRVDIFISAVGHNRLYRNEGEGRFRDVTDETGVAGGSDQWSTSCGWFDYDRDGDLDLLVLNYIVWSRKLDLTQNFRLADGTPAYGRPQNFEGCFPYLYRNEGEGAFVEVAEAAGLWVRDPRTGAPMAKSLGVTFADLDNDGWLDVIVANDTVRNFLFHNQRDGTFGEFGVPAGVAFDTDGTARGAMGIDVADFRNDGRLGIAIGNFANEMTALYVAGRGSMIFVDEALSAGLGPDTRRPLTFGIFYFDVDLDGRLDLFAANGHLENDIHRVQPEQSYEQPLQIFWNRGPRQSPEFVLLNAAETGDDFGKAMVGRGASYADIDDDGDLDVLVTAPGNRPRLLRNDQQSGPTWLRVKLVGTSCNSDAIGAWVELWSEGHVLRRQVMPTRSYASQVELPVTFGLGDGAKIDELKILWPDGRIETIASPRPNRLLTIEQDRS